MMERFGAKYTAREWNEQGPRDMMMYAYTISCAARTDLVPGHLYIAHSQAEQYKENVRSSRGTRAKLLETTGW